MTRAVLEGVALNGRWLLQSVEAYVGRELPVIRILCGGAQSDLWCQIYADVLGRPIERVRDPVFGQLRGAALMALVGLGERSIREASACVHVERRFDPSATSATASTPTVFTEFTRLYRSLRRHHRRRTGAAAPALAAPRYPESRRRGSIPVVNPPSTTNSEPVEYVASETMKRTMRATSSGVPNRDRLVAGDPVLVPLSGHRRVDRGRVHRVHPDVLASQLEGGNLGQDHARPT